MKLRIVTFNAQHRLGEPPARRERRIDALANLLRRQEADVLCLQEVIPETHEDLVERLAPKAAVFCPRDDGIRSGEGVPVYLTGGRFEEFRSDRFWLSPTPDRPSLGWRARCHRLASVIGLHPAGIPEERLWIVNAHLDHYSHEARAKSFLLLREKVSAYLGASHDRIVVCGDFNLRPGDPLLPRFRSGDPPLRDPAETVRPAPTYRGWGPLRFAKKRLDYCLHSDGLACDSYRTIPPVVDGPALSDHNLVRVDLRFR
jgi:endonuclease/exonuclease/phosphatase family metal-dependent hydrolase